MAIFFIFSPTVSHLHPLQAANCDSNSRLVVDEMTMVKSGSKELRKKYCIFLFCIFSAIAVPVQTENIQNLP